MSKLNPIQFNEHLEVHPDKGMAILGGHPLPAVQASWWNDQSRAAKVVTPLENGHLAHIAVHKEPAQGHLIHAALKETLAVGQQALSRVWHGNDFDKLHTQIKDWAAGPMPSADQLRTNQNEVASLRRVQAYGPIGGAT